MGRRALKKHDPTLDISRHYKTYDHIPKVWNTASVFGSDAPLEIEVGSGKGLFIASASADHPETNFLGIEIMSKYARHAAARLASDNRDNAIMLYGDAQPLFHERLPDESVKAVHVYFPDPWWKRRHRKRRIMNEPFLKSAHRALQSDGKFHFWTDVKEYFETALKLVDEVTDWAGPFDVTESSPDHDFDYRTHFERRMRMHSNPIYRSEFRKQS